MVTDIYGTSWLSIRLACHLITVFSILWYMSEYRTKTFVSFLAFLVAGGSFAAFWQGITLFSETAPKAEFPLAVLAFGWMMITLLNGGNMARVLVGTKQGLDKLNPFR